MVAGLYLLFVFQVEIKRAEPRTVQTPNGTTAVIKDFSQPPPKIASNAATPQPMQQDPASSWAIVSNGHAPLPPSQLPPPHPAAAIPTIPPTNSAQQPSNGWSGAPPPTLAAAAPPTLQSPTYPPQYGSPAPGAAAAATPQFALQGGRWVGSTATFTSPPPPHSSIAVTHPPTHYHQSQVGVAYPPQAVTPQPGAPAYWQSPPGSASSQSTAGAESQYHLATPPKLPAPVSANPAAAQNHFNPPPATPTYIAAYPTQYGAPTPTGAGPAVMKAPTVVTLTSTGDYFGTPPQPNAGAATPTVGVVMGMAAQPMGVAPVSTPQYNPPTSEMGGAGPQRGIYTQGYHPYRRS